MSTPLVSIITVVYNGEKYLQQTIDSVNIQTYPNIEYIIVDGQSTDGTLDIIKQNNSKISKWISEKDNGLYDAMNKGIDMASGEVIGIINSDDWYQPYTVETVMEEYLKDTTKTIFHADRYDVLPDGEKKLFPFNPSVFKFKYISMTYNHPSMFVSRKEYERHKYNPELRVYSDVQFVMEAYLHNKENFVYINKPLVNFRIGGVSGQISLWQNLKEGFKARRLAGMNIFGAALYVKLKIATQCYHRIFR